MNHIKLIPTFQRKKSIPKQLKDLELKPLNEQFSKLTMPIISDDEFRPAMMGNFFDMESKKIVSTDAHKLTAINMPKDTYNFIAQKYNKELNENPKGLIFHTLKQMQNDYNDLVKLLTKNNTDDVQSFDEYVKIREIEDAKYPNYEAVIPKEFTNEIYVDYTKLYWYAKVLLDGKIIDDISKLNSSNENEYQNKKIEYLKDSYTSFINPITHQIILTYTLDGEKQYISFNAEFLCNILKFAIEYKGKTFGKVGISGNNRAMVIEFENGLNSINDSIGLIMPVMITGFNVIGDIDTHDTYYMYYNLDNNTILSGTKLNNVEDFNTYEIDESIGFIPLRDFLPTPKIKPNIDMPNDSMSLIDSRIKGLKIALKVAKAENKPKIQKRILGLEIAKKVQNNEKTKNTIKYEDLLEQDRDLQNEIDEEKRKPTNEQSELKRLALEREVILRKIDEMEQFKKGGGVDGIDWYKYDGQYEAEFGNFYLYVIPSNERGRYYVRVTDGYRGDLISESREEILGLDNAKELAIDIVGDYMKGFNNGGGVESSLDYKIIEGYDHYNNYPLYQVVGKDNDYIGEYHTDIKDAKKELKEFENEKFNNGGGVTDLGYNYKSVEEIWDNWTTKQKEHFLYDHQDEYPEIRNISKLANLEWNDLKINYVHVLNSLSNHIREGRYNKGGVVFTNYNGSEIMYEPNYDEYFVNDEVFYSMEEAKNYIDTGEMENEKYGFGGGLLVGSLVGGYLGYKVGKYNKQTFSSGFQTEKLIGKDIKNKLQGKKFVGGGGVDGDIKINDNITIKGNKVMVNGNNGFVNSGTINEWFEDTKKEVQSILNDKDENGEILYKRIAESDNFIYYTLDFEDFNNADYKISDVLDYYAVHKASGRGGDWEIWNGLSFMPLQDEFRYGKLNYQHPSLKRLMQQDSYYKNKEKYADGGGVDTISDEDLLRIKLAVAEAQDRIKANDTESNSGGGLEGITKFVKENPQVLALLEKGGSVGDENYEMLKNKVAELLHHSKELQAVVKKKPKTPAWVISKSSRASTDLSDITHYLEGKL